MKAFDRAFDALLDSVQVPSMAFCFQAITKMNRDQMILFDVLHDYCEKMKQDFRTFLLADTSLPISDLEVIGVNFANNRGENTSLWSCWHIWKSLSVSLS
jgi:hypothetical protein